MMIAPGDDEKTDEQLDEEAEERWEDESPAPQPNPNIVPPGPDKALATLLVNKHG